MSWHGDLADLAGKGPMEILGLEESAETKRRRAEVDARAAIDRQQTQKMFDQGLGRMEGAYGATGGLVDQSRQRAMAPTGRGAPTAQTSVMQAANINQVPQDQMRAQQMQALGLVQDAAMGRGTSVAQQQLQMSTDQNVASAYGMARSMAGTNPGQALRAATDGATMANTQATGQGALLRAQEIAAARGQYGDMAAGMRGQDLNLAIQQAQLRQQANSQNSTLGTQNSQFNASQALNSRQLDDQRQMNAYRDYLNSIGMLNDSAGGWLGAGVTMRGQDFNKEAGITADGRAASQQQSAATGGLLSAGAGALAMLSDRRAKENIVDGGGDVQDMLDKLKPYTWEYKGSGDPQVGIMAQDLEKSSLGKRAIVEAGAYKAVDVNKGLSASLAAVAQLNQRLKALEGK